MDKQILRKIESAEGLIGHAAEANEENLTLTALEWLTAAVKDLQNQVEMLEKKIAANETRERLLDDVFGLDGDASVIVQGDGWTIANV